MGLESIGTPPLWIGFHDENRGGRGSGLHGTAPARRVVSTEQSEQRCSADCCHPRVPSLDGFAVPDRQVPCPGTIQLTTRRARSTQSVGSASSPRRASPTSRARVSEPAFELVQTWTDTCVRSGTHSWQTSRRTRTSADGETRSRAAAGGTRSAACPRCPAESQPARTPSIAPTRSVAPSVPRVWACGRVAIGP